MHDKLIEDIKQELGSRLYLLRKNEDEYQTFWVGVLEALQTADPKRDIIPYLISRGYGEIRNYKRSQMSKDLTSYCETCGRYYGFRTHLCPQCGQEMELVRRKSTYEDYYPGRKEDDVLDDIVVEQFVATLSGTRKYVARRWMIERADLYFDNHIKQIASELDVSNFVVARHKKNIKKLFMEWYYGS